MTDAVPDPQTTQPGLEPGPAKTLRVGPLEVQLENYLAAILTPSGKRRLDLTLTEFRILAHMARTPLRVFSRSEIMQACFDDLLLGQGEDAMTAGIDPAAVCAMMQAAMANLVEALARDPET